MKNNSSNVNAFWLNPKEIGNNDEKWKMEATKQGRGVWREI